MCVPAHRSAPAVLAETRSSPPHIIGGGWSDLPQLPGTGDESVEGWSIRAVADLEAEFRQCHRLYVAPLEQRFDPASPSIAASRVGLPHHFEENEAWSGPLAWYSGGNQLVELAVLPKLRLVVACPRQHGIRRLELPPNINRSKIDGDGSAPNSRKSQRPSQLQDLGASPPREISWENKID